MIKSFFTVLLKLSVSSLVIYTEWNQYPPSKTAFGFGRIEKIIQTQSREYTSSALFLLMSHAGLTSHAGLPAVVSHICMRNRWSRSRSLHKQKIFAIFDENKSFSGTSYGYLQYFKVKGYQNLKNSSFSFLCLSELFQFHAKINFLSGKQENKIF